MYSRCGQGESLGRDQRRRLGSVLWEGFALGGRNGDPASELSGKKKSTLDLPMK